MHNKVKLSVLGFSFNRTQSGTYGLVLSEDEGYRRLMIVVGAPEAQSIAFRLQNVEPPRPLTHDLFKPIFDSFHMVLEEVVIHEFVDGVFHSKLVLRQGDHIEEIDSRTSDAVAIAIRTNTPIYTTEEIMKELAVVLDESAMEDRQTSDHDTEGEYDISLMNIEQLNKELDEAIRKENYELASILRDEIAKKKKDDE